MNAHRNSHHTPVLRRPAVRPRIMTTQDSAIRPTAESRRARRTAFVVLCTASAFALYLVFASTMGVAPATVLASGVQVFAKPFLHALVGVVVVLSLAAWPLLGRSHAVQLLVASLGGILVAVVGVFLILGIYLPLSAA